MCGSAPNHLELDQQLSSRRFEKPVEASSTTKTWLTFPGRQLGLSLVLSQLGPGGRRLVVVDSTFPDKGDGIAHAHLKPGDELVGVGAGTDDEVGFDAVSDLDIDAFNRLLSRLREAPRPLRLLFSRAPSRPSTTQSTPFSKPTRRRRSDRLSRNDGGDKGKNRPPSISKGVLAIMAPFRLCLLLWFAVKRSKAYVRRLCITFFAHMGLFSRSPSTTSHSDAYDNYSLA